jgi:RNA polymerase sigma-70 factor (ECF subfamily)
LSAGLEQVYRQHHKALFSLALTITGCSSLAEDSVHDAFARLLRRVDAPPDNLVPYVFAGVRNSAIDQARSKRRLQQAAESMFVLKKIDTFENDVNALIEAEEKAGLQRAIDSLDDGAREIVVMKVYGHLTFEQIAAVVELPIGTVATRYRRALLKVESQLGNTYDQSKSRTV